MVGIILGIVAAVGALYANPIVDQKREISHASVTPNGGIRESFHIKIPVDRVMVGAAGQAVGLPVGLEWPDDEILKTLSTEMFKVRNERDVIIGIAARIVAVEEEASVIDWVLHIPARGTLFFSMSPDAVDGGHRVGELRTGTEDFAPMTGFITENWVTDTSDDEDAPDGRIELHAVYVSQIEETLE